MTPGDGLANDFWLAFRPALNLRNLGAIGKGLAIAGNTLSLCFDHHRLARMSLITF